MLHEYLSAHDPFVFGSAIATSVGLCLLSSALLPRIADPGESGGLWRSILAGMVLGAAVWLTFRLSLAAYFPFIQVSLPWSALAMSVLLSVMGGGAAVAVTIHGGQGMRDTLLAGSLLSAGASCTLFVSMSALADPLVLGYDLKGVLAAMVAATALCGFGLRRLRGASSVRQRLVPSILIGLALPALYLASLSSILPFTEWETAAATPGALALQPVTVVFVSEFLLVLALTRAGVEVDRQSAARTRRENDRLRQLADCTFEGILVHRGGNIIDANRAFCTLVGLPLDQVLGSKVSRFIHGIGEGQGGGNGSRTQPRELTLTQADGPSFPVEFLSAGLAFGRDGGEVAAVRDIRERKAAEESARDRQRVQDLQREAVELRERQRIAEEASRAKSAFLAMMSHEIRTPMNAVLGLAATLLDESLSADQRKVVGTIRESGDSLMRILNDILDFSKLDAGRMTFELAPFSPIALLDEIGSVHGPQAEQKGLSLLVDAPLDLPSHLLGDGGRIRQVLGNLVSNAIKFTDSGHVAVRNRCLARGGQDVLMEWTVEDTGIGIEASQLNGLFDAFIQADDSITRRFGGSGLGLAISRQIVEQLGGEIGVRSAPGKGSCFRFQLPLVVAASVENQQPPASDSVITLSTRLEARLDALGRPMRLLLAEDNVTNQFVLTRMLAGLPIAIDTAADGREAVGLATRTQYDLIFMDMRMPEMDGLAATKAIRSGDGPSRLVPITALTANAFPEDVAACSAAGMTDFVSKPLAKTALLQAVLRGLDRSTGATRTTDYARPGDAG